MSSATKKALVFLAEGAEEMEAIITVDTLRRGGVEVTLAGVAGDQPVVCSRNVKVVPDCSLDSVASHEFDAVIVPGGNKGAEICSTNTKVGDILKKHYENKKLVAAICAGPTALLSNKIGYGKKITSYPSVKDKMSPHYDYQSDRVVQDGNLITSQGPGTSFEFAIKIVEYLQGHEKSSSMIEPMRLKF